MPKISLAGFKDPQRRPRYIIWTGVAVFGLVAFTILALGVTSSYWFCANGCHKVQDDTITAYNNSTHNKVNCMACHMPANADPVTFMLHKVTALGELYLTATGNYEIPLNKGSHLAMDAEHMPSTQCTQCHSNNRVVSPSPGIIIDHAVHEENEVHCTVCHNRVAHDETGITFVNTDPTTGELNTGHPDFMEMTSCFRCHSLLPDAAAPGACSACHPADFQLKPESHLEEGFFPARHAELANEEIERTGQIAGDGSRDGEVLPGDDDHSEETTAAEEATESAEDDHGEEAEGEEHSEETAGEEEHGDEEHGDEDHGEDGEHDGLHALPAPDEINVCYTCHLQSFCDNCHGMPIPHPAEFVEETHGAQAAEQLDKCDMCHQVTETDFAFCNDCHHGTASNWEYDPAVTWQTQHADAVTTNGVEGCLEQCHEKQYCLDCHNELQPVPSSHTSDIWLNNEITVTNYPDEKAEASAEHTVKANQAPDSCAVCHGEGGPNARFCADCHKYEMPHPDDFAEFHSKTGRDDKAGCQKCHQFAEICSNCHHAGASTWKPWEQVHGTTVNEQGAADCLEACHGEEKFCVDCHTARNAVPASHNANDWTRRSNVEQPAKHPAAYESNAESCTYCHGSGGPNDNEFCSSCHQLEMPHPAEFKDTHKDGFADGSLNRGTCENCHQQAYCDSCHHPQSTGTQPWQLEHPAVVKDEETGGADQCFECHEPTYCAECHVRVNR
jgi:hypothetical protein